MGSAQTVPLTQFGATVHVHPSTANSYEYAFRAVDGWARFIRTNLSMDAYGFTPQSHRWKFGGLERTAREASKRNMGVHVILGGLPAPGNYTWYHLKEPDRNYAGKRYREMPFEWYDDYAAWQIAAVRAMKKAYGPRANVMMRVQMPNEIYSRGEDPEADAYLLGFIPRVIDAQGKVEGLLLDGPSLWGPEPQLFAQIRQMSVRVRRYPEVYRHVKLWPLNMYPPHTDLTLRSPETMTRAYVDYVRRASDLVRSELSGQAYLSEFGVSIDWDARPMVYGERSSRVREQILLDSLDGIRKLGLPYVTIFEAAEPKPGMTPHFGLVGPDGREKVDLRRLRAITEAID